MDGWKRLDWIYPGGERLSSDANNDDDAFKNTKRTISVLITGRGFLASLNWERWLSVKVEEEPPVFFVQTRKLLFIHGKGAKIHLSSCHHHHEKRCKNLLKHNPRIITTSAILKT